MRRYRIIAGLVLALLSACIKPYDFEAQNFEKVLVVDGLITDQEGPHAVQLTYTYPLDTVLNETVNNAQVWVEADNGVRVDYSSSESGTYLSPAGFQGEVGRTYQLFIQMADGTTFASSPESLHRAPAIDSIYGKYAELPRAQEDRNVGGIQFFIDSYNETGQARYFRYEWDEGYQIKVPYPASYEVTEDTVLVPMEEQIGVCYRENFSKDLIYGTTIGTRENRMAEFPVRFVSQEDQALRVRYSILVRQYAITESAYLFYKRLWENNESGGSLFDKQTGSVFGNISSLDNTDQQVLGYFEVSGVSEKRAFFSRSQLDERLDLARFPYMCSPTDQIITVPDSALYYLELSGGNIYAYNPLPPQVYIHSKGCTDCSYYATTTPPDYWID